MWAFHNMKRFYGEELLAPRPTPKLEDHPLSAVCDCLFNTFAATLHTGGFSSIKNLRTHHAVLTGTHQSQDTSICTNLVFAWNNWEKLQKTSLSIQCSSPNPNLCSPCERVSGTYWIWECVGFIICQDIMETKKISTLLEMKCDSVTLISTS